MEKGAPVFTVVDAKGGKPMREHSGTSLIVSLANALGELQQQVKDLQNGKK